MANVTNSDFWQPPSDSDPQHQSSPQAHIVPTSKPTIVASTTPSAQAPWRDVESLCVALASAFSSGRDQLMWRWPAPQMTRLASGQQQLVRVDPQHDQDGPLLRASNSRGEGLGPHLQNSWLVVVDDARQCVSAEYLEAIRQQQGQRTLLVACEGNEAAGATADPTLTDALAKAAARLGWHYIGPLVTQPPSDLLRQLAEIKLAGGPAVLHLKTSQTQPVTVAPDESESTLHDALGFLARLAAVDPRVVTICTSASPSQRAAWDQMPDQLLLVDSGLPGALDWCAESATGGSRPFVVLTRDELLDHLGSIRESICRRSAAVTLIVEAKEQGSDDGDAAPSLTSALRHLDGLSLLSPMDGPELAQMLVWCAAQDAPAVIWLPEPLLASRTTRTADTISLGKADQITTGADVAIIAWGPLAGAACRAAGQLAEHGLTASVVNLRFAQPLDVATIVEAAGQAACLVIVDDASRGGISSSVLEELAHAGVAQPVSVVTTPSVARWSTASEADEAAQAIVERCRWLAEPIVSTVTEAPVETDPELSVSPASGGPWLTFFGQHERQMQLERQQVYATQLSSDVGRWVAQYQEIGSRDLYLWKWCRLGAEITTLPGVVPELRAHVCDTKVLSIVLCVLLDDVADQHGNGQLLDALLEMTCSGTCRSWPRLGAVEKRHAEIARALWTEYQQRISGYPRHGEFAPVLQFDLQQFFNTMRYSHLVNGRPYLLNMTEHDLYTSHNMMMISFGTLDLMCSPDFPLDEVSALREMLWHAQNMGRIGNLLSTWLRELGERDFTSGVFARALRDGDLTLEQLQHEAPAAIEATIRGRGHLAHFYRKWQQHRELCHARAGDVGSLDLQAVLDGHDRFFAMHLGSQGLI